jgi:hypothetical protein
MSGGPHRGIGSASPLDCDATLAYQWLLRKNTKRKSRGDHRRVFFPAWLPIQKAQDRIIRMIVPGGRPRRRRGDEASTGVRKVTASWGTARPNSRPGTPARRRIKLPSAPPRLQSTLRPLPSRQGGRRWRTKRNRTLRKTATAAPRHPRPTVREDQQPDSLKRLCTETAKWLSSTTMLTGSRPINLPFSRTVTATPVQHLFCADRR